MTLRTCRCVANLRTKVKMRLVTCRSKSSLTMRLSGLPIWSISLTLNQKISARCNTKCKRLNGVMKAHHVEEVIRKLSKDSLTLTTPHKDKSHPPYPGPPNNNPIPQYPGRPNSSPNPKSPGPLSSSSKTMTHPFKTLKTSTVYRSPSSETQSP